MEYQTFKEELCRILQKRTEGKKKVILQQVEKNNGVVLDAVVLQGEKEQVLPTIYLEELYEIYEEGATLEQIAGRILCEEEKWKEEVEFSLEEFEDYTRARTSIFYKLVNYQMNERMLKRVPHIRYLDLAVVFYYRVEQGHFPGGSVLIHNNNLVTWGITKSQLMKDAAFNTSRKLPYSFVGM